MNISLTDELTELVRQKVKSGLFNSASEVVRTALRLMEREDRLSRIREEEFRKAVAKGVADLDQGRFTEIADEADLQSFMDDVKARGRTRLSDQPENQA